jgi:hypothetical protein
LSSSDATIDGTVSMNATAGVANFANKGVKLTGLVGSRNLTAAISSPSAISKANGVNITVGAAHHVEPGVLAANAVNGSAFGTQPTARIVDISGNLTASTASVVVSSSGATLGGTKTKQAVAGTATFTDLSLTGTVGSYTLTFASTGLGSGVANISLTAGGATQLSIVVASTLVNDTVFATQPVVTIKDASGNTVIDGAQSTQLVTLSSTDAIIGGTSSSPA